MNRVQQHFMRSIGAGLLAGAMIAPAMAASNAPAAEPGPKAQGAEKTCVSIYSIKARQGEDAAKILQFFNKAGVSPDQPQIGKGIYFVCLEPNLRYDENIFGAYDFDGDVMRVDTGTSDEADRVITFRHESRHRVHNYLGISHTRAINIPESERVMIALLAEADARVDEVLLADDARRLGNMAYVDALRKESTGAKILKAFDDSLRIAPGDMAKAMRAVVFEFLADARQVKFYTDYFVQGMNGAQRERFAFNPAKPRQTMMDDATLKKFGERVGMSNYMDDGLMWMVRHGFSQEKYESAAALVRRPAGVIALKAKP